MTFRAVAREAVIFSLLGMVLAGVGAIITAVLHAREAGKSAAREAVRGSLPPPIGYRVDNSIEVPLSDGTVLFVADCDQVHAKDDMVDQVFRDEERKKRGNAVPTGELPPGNIDTDCVDFKFEGDALDRIAHKLGPLSVGDPNQVAIEKEYWRSYVQTRNIIFKGDVLAVLMVCLAGFPAGLVVWLFYRTVRFAVKG